MWSARKNRIPIWVLFLPIKTNLCQIIQKILMKYSVLNLSKKDRTCQSELINPQKAAKVEVSKSSSKNPEAKKESTSFPHN